LVRRAKMDNMEFLIIKEVLTFWAKSIWYGLAIGMFIEAVSTGKEIYALLALVAAMMKKD
jgi:hypothetical protein